MAGTLRGSGEGESISPVSIRLISCRSFLAARRSVLDGLRLAVEPLGPVAALGGDALQSVLERAGGVGAAHQLAARLPPPLGVRLGAAAVAAVVGSEPGGFESEVHGILCSTDPGADGSVHSPGSPGAQSPVSRTAPPRTASGGCAVRGVVRRRIRRVS